MREQVLVHGHPVPTLLREIGEQPVFLVFVNHLEHDQYLAEPVMPTGLFSCDLFSLSEGEERQGQASRTNGGSRANKRRRLRRPVVPGGKG